ncbi:glycine--tRNA ligase subunit beta [Coleofasciculus sp. FACHB-SPT36]|uniref:glycine--tRNA ligase subunit beta n=1 Tax=Cyanophyceae TaxID=3028117 RepID=UPI00168AA0E8|nr:glycine--tRNA ligase subunit beta [Coleofasciculus sp. FACHB-SPT36]MBD2540914.1 glycine--tRNA ligase subunit beta [Coleofasciculus sp. FACHB-SPT36]
MSTFLLEVGTEELPASFVNDAIAQWRSRIPASLTENSLAHEAIEVYATPRRLAVLIKGLPTQQPDREEEVKGPPAQAAFKDGQPTKAAEGFARKLGVELNALEIRPTDKGDFVFVRQTIPGRPTAEILTQLVSQWIFGLEGKRLMRWGDGDIKFPRPIEWLVALLNDAVLPIELVNGSETIKSDRITRAHRVLHPESVTISQADDYVDCLRSASVEVNPESRQTKIQQQVQAAAQKMDGYTEIYPDLLQEVTHLVEFPTAVVGKFDSEFLSLPTEVITTVMVTHQRYFPVFKTEKSKELLPYFITISNGDPAKSDIIAEGNARVIRARLADGQYFYKADLSQPLEDYLPQLEKVTFQEDLGSVRQKVERLVKIAGHITEQLQLEADEKKHIERATLLCKADLVTQMVGEFPELQGIMGQKYALASNESEAVATAIFEHYLPRGAGDSLPQTITGQVVALADRLDTLVSIFGLGMLPTGSSDPFALRRAANAVVNITWAADLPINLHQLLQQIVADFVGKYTKIIPLGANVSKDLQQKILQNIQQKNDDSVDKYFKTKSEELVRQLQEFFLQRIRNLLQDERNTDYDLVNAVLGDNDPEYTERALKDLLDVRDRALFLQTIRNNGKLNEIYETVNRSTRLAAQGDLDKAQLQPETVVRPELFQKASEQAFYDALVQIVPQTQASQEQRNYQLLVDGLAQIAPTVSTFFDGAESVLVMDADPNIKRNRLNILGLLRNHARVLADFGAIVKS